MQIVASAAVLIYSIGFALYLVDVMASAYHRMKLDQPEFMRKWPWAYRQYRKTSFYWHGVTMMYAFILVIIRCYLWNTPLQIPAAILMVFSMVTLTGYSKPFGYNSLDYMYSIQGFIEFSFLFLGLFIHKADQDKTHSKRC